MKRGVGHESSTSSRPLVSQSQVQNAIGQVSDEVKVPAKKKTRTFTNKEDYMAALCRQALPIFPVGTQLPGGCWATGDPSTRPTAYQQPALWQQDDPSSRFFVKPGEKPQYYKEITHELLREEKETCKDATKTSTITPTAKIGVTKSARPWDKPPPTEEEVLNAVIAPAVTDVETGCAFKFQKTGRWGNCLVYSGENLEPIGPNVIWSKEQAPAPKAPTQRAIGGLRHLNEAMNRLPIVNQIGARVYLTLKELLEEKPHYIDATLEHIGRSDCYSIEPEMTKDVIARMVKVLTPLANGAKLPEQPDNTPVNVPLLALWCFASKDPDTQPLEWLQSGAPAGLRHHIIDKGIFPVYDEEEDAAEGDPEALSTSYQEFVNYSGVEENEEVATEFRRMHTNKYVKKFASVEEAEVFLGEKPILSKIGVIEKIRNNKKKTRIVVDTKESKVTKATRKYERSLLPRAIDVTYDVLDLMRAAEKLGLSYKDIDFLIADFKDAFFIIPNRSDERKWFVVSFRGEIYVFMRTTQGSRGAPLTWARFAALISRMTQAILDSKSTRINTYVDDPIIVALGPKKERDMKYAMVLLVWSALGLPLSLEKAVRGLAVTWTSAIFTPGPWCVTVEVKRAIIEDVASLVNRFLSKNVIPTKELRSLTGKLTHVASVVMTLRPFLTELYGAQVAERENAPVGCIWRKQIQDVLLWAKAFLEGTPGELKRCYSLSSYTGSGLHVSLELDASPWGLGGVLLEQGKPVAWFASPLSTEELEVLELQLGDCAAQQAVEALCALVALRAWFKRWQNLQPTIRVRSDSVSALVLAIRLKTKGRAPGIIAREIALDIAAAHYVPHVAEHVPGLHNVIPDALSRKFQPGQTFVVPRVLQLVPETVLEMRGRKYFRSIAPPPQASNGKSRAALDKGS